MYTVKATHAPMTTHFQSKPVPLLASVAASPGSVPPGPKGPGLPVVVVVTVFMPVMVMMVVVMLPVMVTSGL